MSENLKCVLQFSLVCFTHDDDGTDTNIEEQARTVMQKIYDQNEEGGLSSAFYAPKT